MNQISIYPMLESKPSLAASIAAPIQKECDEILILPNYKVLQHLAKTRLNCNFVKNYPSACINNSFPVLGRLDR